MKNIIIIFILSLSSLAQGSNPRTRFFPKMEAVAKEIPSKDKVWVFILAGQSNMAGRGLVEAQDTVPSLRILTINKKGQIILAKEPLHFYEPSMAGLDCGLYFGKALLKSIPDSITILLLPTAVGGSSIGQWLSDSEHRGVKLLSNFKEKVNLSEKYGILKGILWIQGESDANAADVIAYPDNLKTLFKHFRTTANNQKLTILTAEIGIFSAKKEETKLINSAIRANAKEDLFTDYVSTRDLKDRGDKLHFNSEGQRMIGTRFAKKYLRLTKRLSKKMK